MGAIGKIPITMRWIDINKGDQENPNYRSRIVARELNTHKRDDLFAATPPLEALKLVLSMTATANKGEVVMINDISRAFFHAKVERDVFIQLPDEDRKPGEEHLCGKLRLSMYGTRDAAQNWYKEYSQQLIKIGFVQGIASPCTFYHNERQIRTYVHGDDYVSTGKPNDLKWMQTELEKKYQVKTQVLGPNEGQQKQVKILNRVVTWDGSRGIVYEADPRHTEIVIEQLRLNDAKEVSTPGTREEGRTTEDNEEQLSEKDKTRYRAIVARLNYFTPDRPDIAYAVKELARAMSNPSNGDWLRLKRLGRYMKGRPRLQQVFEWQPAQGMVTTYSDADWAGCKQTRKSTTGGCITIGRHTIKGWSETQALVALSSGESELYAAIKAAAETLGIMSMMKDFNWKVAGQVYGDASAALGIINRTGLGKTRHIDTSLLWIQQTAAERQLKFSKVLGRNNPADLYTKYLDLNTINTHVKALNYHDAEGRAAEAPKLHLLSQSWTEYTSTGEKDNWEWLKILVRTKTQKTSRCRGHVCTITTTRRSTGSGPWVLWRYKRQVQGYNGSNAAQPSRLQGSTLTFQLYAGVPWVQGLRHGVTMHPRGRHLREGRIPWSHGTSHTPTREQQPTTKPLLLPIQPQELQGEEEVTTQGRRRWAECRAVSPHQPEEIVQVVRDDAHTRLESIRRDGKVLNRGVRQYQCDAKEQVPEDKCWMTNNKKCENKVQHNYNQSPLREVSQRSSIALGGTQPGEPNLGVRPKANVTDGQCESWLGPLGTRSNLVSQRDGWRDVAERNKKNYSSINLENTTTARDQNNYHGDALTNYKNARVGGDNQNSNNHYKDGSDTLEDSTGEESNTLEDTTTTVITCFGDTSNLCSRFSRQPQGLRLRGVQRMLIITV